MDADEIAQRKTETPVVAPVSNMPWEELFREKIGQMADGAVREMAGKYRGIANKTPRHDH